MGKMRVHLLAKELEIETKELIAQLERLVAQPQADLDVEATYHWYESERSGLGTEFLHELRATYDRIVKGPRKRLIFRAD